MSMLALTEWVWRSNIPQPETHAMHESKNKDELEIHNELVDLKRELVTSLASGCADIARDQVRHQGFNRSPRL